MKNIQKPIPGVKTWENEGNGFLVFQVHYTANPFKQTPQWRASESIGIPRNEWNREYEIDFSSFQGKPVFESDYDESRMVRPLGIHPKYPILRGWDFGYHHPAVVWCQFVEGQQLRVLAADMGTDVDFRQYARHIINKTKTWFGDRGVLDTCDFAGKQKKGTGPPEISLMRTDFGLSPRYKYVKIEHTLQILRRLMASSYKKEPCFLVNDDPSTEFLREALRGGYHYDEPKDGKSAKEEPADGDHSHPIDALRYVAANFCGVEGNQPKILQKISTIDVPPEGGRAWSPEEFQETEDLVGGLHTNVWPSDVSWSSPR